MGGFPRGYAEENAVNEEEENEREVPEHGRTAVRLERGESLEKGENEKRLEVIGVSRSVAIGLKREGRFTKRGTAKKRRHAPLAGDVDWQTIGVWTRNRSDTENTIREIRESAKTRGSASGDSGPRQRRTST